MKISLRFFIPLLLLCNYCFSQKDIPYFNLHKKISFFITLEEKLGSTKFDTGSQYISMDDSAQPVIYRRKEKGIPDLLVYYTFSKKDSLVTEILYEWDKGNFEKNDNKKMSLEFNKALANKYLSLQKSIVSVYGSATTEGSLENLSKTEESGGLKRSDLWKPNDSLKINMYTSISNYYKKEGMVTTTPTHRIRLYVNYTAGKKENDLLSKSRIATAEKTYADFISYLKNENFEAAKKLLSEKIRASVTPEIFNQLKTSLVTNRKAEVYMSGMQLVQDGNQYLMLQFKYTDDTASPPKECIKVLYSNDDTILGIQPMTRN